MAEPTAEIIRSFAAVLEDLWNLIRPGGTSHTLHWESFIANNGHFIIELALIAIILYLMMQKGKPSERDEQPLTESEVESLCNEWLPEPLCPQTTELDKRRVAPVVTSMSGAYAKVNGRQVVNFCSANFLGVAGRSDIMDSCKDTLKSYGCGSCGPRGFYGTIDVHLKLEEQISRFMGTEEAIIYSYDLATLPSIIPAFANRKDVIICDEGVNFSIQNGCNLSRSRILTFKHNDVHDLKRIMEMVAAEERQKKKKLNRKYVVVEGIYANFGDLAPLDKIFELKEHYKYRLIVDESLSLGVLGKTGRGACEHYGIHGRAEIVAASMGNSMASIGGFCCGDREICDHQRLSGSGYCFSASLPPFLATAALGALHFMEGDGQARLPILRELAAKLRNMLSTSISGLALIGHSEDAVSPVIHLALQETLVRVDVAEAKLQAIVDHCLEQGVLLTLNSVSRLDESNPVPTIRLVVTSEHSNGDLSKLVSALAGSVKVVLKK